MGSPSGQAGFLAVALFPCLLGIAGGCAKLSSAAPPADGGRDLPASLTDSGMPADAPPAACIPHTGTCNGATAHTCKADGSGFEDVYCDPLQGLTCDAARGACAGSCTAQNMGRSYIGCDYYPTVTANLVSNTFHFAVAVSNTTSDPADIVIDGGALAAAEMFRVAPNSVVVRQLPWHPGLKAVNCTGECRAPLGPVGHFRKGAYHLRSTQPVTVYQFNALEYQLGTEYSYTNDASLLLPANVLGRAYMVAAWPGATDEDTGRTSPGLLAVTATQDGTAVEIKTRADTIAGHDAPVFKADVPQTVMLDQGDVLELFSAGLGDLTGSLITASKPVQVIAGAFCANVPVGRVACDHLEDSIFPVETLSTRYLVAAPATPERPGGNEQVVRIIAAQDGTTSLTFDPPIAGGQANLSRAGDFIQITRNAASFQVTSDKKILVAHYMIGQGMSGESGDPSMALAVATDQYRRAYRFHAPINYETNYVSVTAPVGAVITLDGAPVTGFQPIGDTGFAAARVALDKAVENHTATGDMNFGISVYGYGRYTSYWYPGGLDLDVIVIP